MGGGLCYTGGMKSDVKEQGGASPVAGGCAVISTRINREYAVRFLGVAVLFIALSGWFLYDGKIGYPQENAQVAPVAAALAQQQMAAADWMNTAKTGKAPLAEAFEQAGVKLPAHYSDTFLSWIRAGEARAQEVEAARQVLLQPVHSAEAIHSQFVSAAIGLLAALVLMGIVAVRWLTRFVLEETFLTVQFGKVSRRYALETLREMDTRQWEKRGILTVQFAGGRVVLDAWHHTGVREIAARLMDLPLRQS